MRYCVFCSPLKTIFIGVLVGLSAQAAHATDVQIQIPDGLDQEVDASYRLDYVPPQGSPAPNTTIFAKDIGTAIQVSRVLPGTKYEFTLYYSNFSHKDVPMYTASIVTAPDPPSNLIVSVINETSVLVKFDAPMNGEWASFNLKLFSIVEKKSVKNENLREIKPYILTHLVPGGTYQIQLLTIYENKESLNYALYNFTTKPSPPVLLTVWFRNETTLRFLWQPPLAYTIYSHYKVMIEPGNAPESVLIVEKGDPPGPARAVFKDLVPGRFYNLSVQTESEGVLSVPISAQYHTTPLRPARLQVEPSSVTTSRFTVVWDPPEELTEYDKYQISINLQQPPVMRNTSEPRMVTYSERLHPGQTYQVSAMTVSGKVYSSEAIVNVTLKPLPVKNLKAVLIRSTGSVKVTWKPANSSLQDSYEVSYTEVYNNSVLNGDTNTLISRKTEYLLESLLPGRNYSISVKAVSKNALSSPMITFQATRPSAPVIEDLKPIEYGLNISWKSDVNSRQEKYEIRHQRNDTKSEPVINNTKNTNLLIDHLYPGAGYNITIFAISHNLRSEPHDYFQAVYPKPPSNLLKENITSNSITLSWETPKESLFSEFYVRFRTEDTPKWNKNVVKKTVVEIRDLGPGQCYFIEVNSVSFGVESARPLNLNHTVYPSPVSEIAPLVDSHNVTIAFPRPPGRIEYYVINWTALEIQKSVPRSKNVSAGGLTTDRVRILVDELIPGVKYQFDIHTVSFGLHSNPTLFAARTMPLILSELVVVSHSQKTDTMTIHYTQTPQGRSHFDKYRFNISDSNRTLEKDADDTDWKVTFTDLIPGKLYNITVWTVSGKVLSQPLHRQDRLYPDPVGNLRTTHITDSLVTLVWDKPGGVFSSYEVQYLNTDGVLVQNLTTEETCSVSDLKPYRNYTFTVTVRSGSGDSNYLRRSIPLSASFRTQEGLPGMVKEFISTDVQPREITFEWSLPESQWNGILKKFTITYGQEGSEEILSTDFMPRKSKGTINDLQPGKTYVFKIQAQTKVGSSPESVWKEETPILAPPKPSSQIVPTEVCRTSSTIQVRFRKNYFSNENGLIVNYTIIVAEDDTKNSSGIEMPSWFDVQAYSIWPPYQVMEPYYPFKNSTIEDYTIGSEDCTDKLKGYCNGPLKGGTVYRVKIRAFTTPNKFTDTEYSFSIQTDTNRLPIILGSTLGVILIIVLISVAVVLRRFKIALSFGKKAPKKKISENLSLADCIIETSKPIKLEKFADYFEIMSADSDLRFSEEFEQLKHIGREQNCLSADLPCNRSKNRFTNILPYDHSRFKLQPVDDEEGSDYINANYIPGYNSPREFIVTQGPLPSTKDDFWRMCWESNSRAIVMLTRCIEKGREKCDHYWPEDTKSVYYGDIAVTISNENHLPNWTITELVIERGDVQRTVKHFHFTTWPDFGVPSPPTILVRFVRTFRERISSEPRPIIVHCSAGVGRSGTFIAIDRIIQSLNNGADTVDIFGVVYQMRKERVLMVQTEQQYICIHKCILPVLKGTENQPPREDIHQNQGFEDDEGIGVSGM